MRQIQWRWVAYFVLVGMSTGISAQPRPAQPLRLSIAPQVSEQAAQQWHVGQGTWRYQSTSAVRFVLGNYSPKLISGLASVPLGGVSIADQTSGWLGQHVQWRYGAAFGAVDKKPTVTSFQYGSGAGRAWVDVKISPSLSLDGLYQRAEGYEQLGLGGRYDFGLMGTGALNVVQSHHQKGKGWRYQGRYQLQVADTLAVGLQSESYKGLFSDLLQHQNHGYTVSQDKHAVDLQWEAGRWGKLGASYASTAPRLGHSQHTFGLSQQFWYSPNLRIDVDAQRQTHSGDYNMGLRFSLPLF